MSDWKTKTIHVSNVILIILLGVLVYGSWQYLYSTRPCAQPIYYRVGSFDTRFGLSQADYISDLQQAAALWNQAAGHTVLAYSATGTMPVNLIYDERQQETNTGESISAQESQLAAQKAQIQSIQAQYDAAKQQYETDQASGMDPATLNAEAASLNQLAAQIQQQVTIVNANISAVNANATSYNEQAAGQFEEGEFVQEYGTKHIDLYEFTNHTQLIRLMAHEFGHSLGLAHNSNPESIMYPENTATTISLSADDIAELTARCAVTPQNLNPFGNASPSMQ